MKDPGGMNGILPVLPHLRKMQIKPVIFGTGKAAELLPGRMPAYTTQRRFFRVTTANDIMRLHAQLGSGSANPFAVLTSMCSEGGAGRDIIPLMRAMKIRTIAYQDFWGARLKTDWQDVKYRPDAICVGNRYAAELVTRAWSEYDPARVKITGFTTHDQYANYDADSAVIETTRDLHLDDKPVVFYLIENISGAGRVTKDLIEVMNGLGSEINLVAHYHPRMGTSVPEEIPECEKALGAFRAGRLIRTEKDLPYADIQRYLAASSLVVAMWSTILVEASLFRKDALAIMYPDIGIKHFQGEMGGQMDQVPVVALRAAHQAESKE
ncbi:MAG: hypothetical protein Q8Q13_00145, partial [bacterium]|nr:hypothetical protein [bacterium]